VVFVDYVMVFIVWCRLLYFDLGLLFEVLLCYWLGVCVVIVFDGLCMCFVL